MLGVEKVRGRVRQPMVGEAALDFGPRRGSDRRGGQQQHGGTARFWLGHFSSGMRAYVAHGLHAGAVFASQAGEPAQIDHAETRSASVDASSV
ncbi:MAG: hypothetical protein CL927_11990 [Deltaproteobacteria bacterium]|nr:hypothetical protein [Deltaproteobacteria bacterium]